MAQIRSIEIKNFRCFDHFTINFNVPIVLIEGNNGTGKTALLEAIYYLCYLRSFRTYAPKDLIQFNKGSFFIRGVFDLESEINDLQVGVSRQNKKTVKLNNKPVQSFKDLFGCLRVISLIEGDLQIVQGAPDMRRHFIDSYIFLHEESFVNSMHAYRRILEQRNSLLQRESPDCALLRVLTQQLWSLSSTIYTLRLRYLEKIQHMLNGIQKEFGIEGKIILSYSRRKRLENTFEEFEQKNPSLKDEEVGAKRTLFGPHLDDISIQLNGRNARYYASRGQQKLIILLLKISQAKSLIKEEGLSILLLDDFMTDFDERRIDQLLNLLIPLKCFLCFTCAQRHSLLEKRLDEYGVQKVLLESWQLHGEHMGI